MTTDIVLTVLLILLTGLSVLLIPWLFFLIARAMIRDVNRKAVTQWATPSQVQ